MNINNINNSINFGKAINIAPASRDNDLQVNSINTERNIAKVLNNEKCDVYSKEEKEQIKEFFKPLMGEETTPVVFKYYDAGKFIVSGQDAKDILSLNNFMRNINDLQIPDTEYKQAGGYDIDEGQIENILKTFKRNTTDYVIPKINGILNKAFNNDKNQTIIDIVNDDPNSTKAQSIVATVKTKDGGLKTTTLNLNA